MFLPRLWIVLFILTPVLLILTTLTFAVLALGIPLKTLWEPYKRRFAELVPPLNPGEFYLSSYVSLFLLYVGLWIVSGIDDAKLIAPPGLVETLRRPMFDPAFPHVVASVFIAFLLYRVCRRANFGPAMSLLVSVSVPVVVLSITQAFVSGILKPTVGLARTPDYNPTLEPAITRWWRSVAGVSEGFPSGSVTRQTLLTLLGLWVFNRVEIGRPGRVIVRRVVKVSVYSISLALVAFVACQRVVAGGHRLFDVVGGIAVGILACWFATIPFTSLVVDKNAILVAHLGAVWIAFSIGLCFYSREPLWWAIVSSLGYLMLVGLSYELTRRFKLHEAGRSVYARAPHTA